MRHIFVLLMLSIFCAYANADSNDKKAPQKVIIGVKDQNGAGIGLEFPSPQEDDWTIKGHGLSVTLNKKSNSENENREIEAYLIKLDAPISPIANYIETIKRNIVEGYADSKYFKINILEIAEDPKDKRCVRIHLLLEATQPDSVTQQKKWSEQYILSCGLLKYKGRGFELHYYHRYIDSNKDTQFGEKAKKIMDSAVIIEDDGN
ncbi:hypothetical protein [Azospira inquinata]|uniref:Secreted protein n=1 Tax=Azospira inquinata TaxID=2785627 RepID=A0A975SMX3_9RHOO|nr:hypothetical protein [Azospira inquinata]QWT45402.1 hypothetical protein J8L76_10660 [Azospira inquinata]QWT49270.1 hypothetical protein Azoinq_01220 [Azospira inquinata]